MTQDAPIWLTKRPPLEAPKKPSRSRISDGNQSAQWPADEVTKTLLMSLASKMSLNARKSRA